MIVLGAQPETSYRTIIPRLRTIRVTDKIGDCKLIAFHPELSRLVNGRIYYYPAVGHHNGFRLIVRCVQRSGLGFMVPDKKVLECPILFRIGWREIVHVDMEEVNETLDLLVRLRRYFFLS